MREKPLRINNSLYIQRVTIYNVHIVVDYNVQNVASISAPPARLVSRPLEDAPPLSLDFARGHVGTVLWATGSRPDYSWLHVPAFDHKGRLRHDGGIVDVPGLYVLGLTFMRRRKSSFIHGAEDDARELSTHLADYLRGGMEAPSFEQRRLSA